MTPQRRPEVEVLPLKQKQNCKNLTHKDFGSSLRISSLTSGKSSKLDVSSMDFTSTGMAAGRSRMCSQSTPRKNGMSFSSSMPFCIPSLLSASQQNLQQLHNIIYKDQQRMDNKYNFLFRRIIMIYSYLFVTEQNPCHKL